MAEPITGATATAEPALDPVLTASEVTVQYRGHPPVRAVDGVSLTVAAGEVVALVGESGCGKSSLAKAVIGIEKRAGGSVLLDNIPVPALRVRRRSPAMTVVQMVFQDPNSSLNPRRRVGDQIADGIRAALARGDAGSDPGEWLERVNIDPSLVRSYPHEFSGGQKQRIAVARALAARPRVLIADEPISALDASTQAAVAELMRSLCVRAGAGMLFISHDLAVVRRIADRTFVMYAGRVVESGHTETIWQDPRHPYTRALLAAIPVPDGLRRLPAAPSDEDRQTWTTRMPEALGRTPDGKP